MYIERPSGDSVTICSPCQRYHKRALLKNQESNHEKHNYETTSLIFVILVFFFSNNTKLWKHTHRDTHTSVYKNFSLLIYLILMKIER